MKKRASVLTVLALLMASTAVGDPGIRILEDFTRSIPGQFPAEWRKDKDKPAPYDIRIENGNAYLHALDKGESIKIFTKAEWDPRKIPVLRFRWRVHQLPAGANETERPKNDSAAGVYVLFERRGIQIVPNALKYVWSTSLPVGSAVRTGRGFNQIVVLRSGETQKGEWVEETVNVCSDYVKYFGKKPPEVGAIGVLTDANATKSIAEADYDDFVLVEHTSSAGDPAASSCP